MVKQAGFEVVDQELQDMLKAADRDKDGKLQFHEFFRLMNRSQFDSSDEDF